jgi:hypothetical protein
MNGASIVASTFIFGTPTVGMVVGCNGFIQIRRSLGGSITSNPM